MPAELVAPLAVLAAIVVAVLVARRIPAVRHVVRTAVDMVDGSLGVYMVRDLLGRDTTTRRDRRIAVRRAREQAEIERRIGGPIDPAVVAAQASRPAAIAPSRLVVSGDPVTRAAPSAEVAPAARPAPAPPRGRLLRDATAMLVVAAIVIAVVSMLNADPDGEVAGVTGAPDATVLPEVRATATTVPTAAPATEPAPAAAGATPTPTPAPTPTAATVEALAVTGLDHRLVGRTGGGTTVPIELTWAAVPGEGVTYALEERIDGGAWTLVELDDPWATSVRRSLAVGSEHAYRITAVGADGGEGPAATWPVLTPSRHQETSSLARFAGGWRSASGPSLSGGGVVYAQGRGASVEFRFTGRDVAWIGTRTPLSGRAEIRLDGRRVDTIDLDGLSVQYGRILFQRHFEERGAHRLEIRVVGDGRVDVDAFVVLR